MPQPSFFIKPGPDRDQGQCLYAVHHPGLNGLISFRSLQLDKDLPVIHDWVNQPYAGKFWQLAVEADSLRCIYASMLDHPLGHSFIGLLDDRIVCQIDCYHVSAEEIKDHVPAENGYCGLHILTCPPRESRKGLTEALLRSFIAFYFSHPEAEVLYGEPDCENRWANLAASRAGFRFEKAVQLSYKTANLYSITKAQFQLNSHVH